MKRTVLVMFFSLLVSFINDKPVKIKLSTKQLDRILTVDTTSKKIRFIDDKGREVGSTEFSDSIVVEIRRRKQ